MGGKGRRPLRKGHASSGGATRAARGFGGADGWTAGVRKRRRRARRRGGEVKTLPSLYAAVEEMRAAGLRDLPVLVVLGLAVAREVKRAARIAEDG